jgi:hypothetical protein
MKNIAAIHEFIRFLVKKHRNGFLSPEEIDDAVNWASLDLFNSLYGMTETYQQGRPVPPTAYGMTQKVLDDLQVFITDPTALTLTAGVAPLPADYCHWSKIETTNDGDNFRRNRKIAAPSTKSPVCRIFNNKIEFLPTNLLAVDLTYLKYPVKAEWAYTIVNNRPVYDDGNSVAIEWGEDNHQEIIARALKYLGLNLEDTAVYQYADIKTKTGQ